MFLKTTCSNILLGSSIYLVRNLSRTFQYSCSLRISHLLYDASIKFDAFLRVSLWTDSFAPSKTLSLVLIPIMLKGITIFLPSPSKESDSSSSTFLFSISTFFLGNSVKRKLLLSDYLDLTPV